MHELKTILRFYNITAEWGSLWYWGLGTQWKVSTVCPTRYRTRHFFNNSNTNEDIATKFEQDYVSCVRNEEEYVCSRYNIPISGKIVKEMPGSVASGTQFINAGGSTNKISMSFTEY